MKKYLIEFAGDQEIIEAENYETALKIACDMFGLIVSDVTNIK